MIGKKKMTIMPSGDISEGLLANIISEYKFENNVLDTVGVNDGVATSLTYDVGLVGQTGVFNGVTSKVEVSHSIGSTFNEMSFTCLVKNDLHTQSLDTKTGIAKLTNLGSTSHYPWITGDIYLSILTSVRKLIGVGIVADRTQWHHLAVTANELTNVWKFYQNGTLVFTSTVGTLSISTPIIFGNSTTFFYAGKMDCVRIWNKELSQTEVTEIATDELNGIDINP